VWKAVGVALFLCGAVLTALSPDSVAGQAAYLGSFGGLVLVAWIAALSGRPARRRPWVLIALAVTAWWSGDAVTAAELLAGRTPGVGLPDVFWVGGYPLLGAALVSLVRSRGPGRGRTAAQDGLTLTTAAAVAVWQFFIVPGLQDGGPVLALLAGVLYPVGDLVLFAAVIYLVLSPGRNGVPSALLVAGSGLTLVVDCAMTFVTPDWPAVDADRLNGALLVANLLVVAPMLRRDRDQLTRPATAGPPGVHPARLVFLGAAMLTAPVLAVLGGDNRFLLLAATVVTVGLCLTRFAGAVREQARTQQRLIHQAGHDSLTGLANRRTLGEHLDRGFARRDDLVLLYLDLDGFKAVNDEHGHATGDAVLVEAARRIRGQVRSGDLCCRLGGDEFAVLCPGLDRAEAAGLADRIGHALAEPMLARGVVVQVGASVGLAVAADCADGDDMLSRSDDAMFAAKRRRRSPVPVPAATGT
jgi:diguanylate cyclase (GGDEF)-like protein